MTTRISSPRPCRLAVAMIVRDEADVLRASIESVRPVADEIVVLDTGSRDETKAMAEQLGAKVHEMPWADDFSAARNRLLEEVSADWVLWLDAGEELTADSAAELREYIDRQADSRKVYMLWVEVPPAEPDGSAEQAARARLMPKHPGLRFAGRVCETVVRSARAAGLAFDTAPGRIRRHRRQHDPDRKTQRGRRNLRLIERETAASGDGSPRMRLAAGEAYSDLGDLSAARKAFGDALEAAEHGSLEMLEGYYGLLASLDGDPTQQQRQVNVCLEALEIFPLDAQLLCAVATYLQGRNNLDLAARAFQTAVAYGQVNVEAWHLREIGEVAATCLALVLQLAGKDDQARAALEEAIERHPDSVRLRRHLLNLHIKQGHEEEAVAVADPLQSDPARRAALADAVRGACCAARQEWLPALGHLQGAVVAGCDDPLCLRWLAVTLLSNGRTEEAEPVVRQWLQRQPNNPEAQRYLAAVEQQPTQDAGTPPAGDRQTSRQFRIDSGRSAPEPAAPQAPAADGTPSPGRASGSRAGPS